MSKEASPTHPRQQISDGARRAVSALFFVDGCAVGGWVSHIADAKLRLGLPNHVLGLALLASAAGAVTTMPFAGALIHRFGSRNVAVASGLALCFFTLLPVLAPSLPLLVLALYAYGAANGQLDVSMNAHSVAVQERFPRPILSAVHGWFSVGGAVGGMGAAAAAMLGGSPIQHLMTAAVVLIAVLLVCRKWLLPADTDQAAEGPRFVLPQGKVLALGLLVLASFVAEASTWDWSGVYFRGSLGATAAMGSIAVGAFSFAMSVGRFLGDGIVHRFGHRTVILLSGLLSAGGIWFTVTAGNPVWAIVGIAVSGIGISNQVPILFRAAGSVPGISAGTGLAAVTTLGYSGFLGGPPLVGSVADWRSLGFALGLMGLLCLAVAIFGPRWTNYEDD